MKGLVRASRWFGYAMTFLLAYVIASYLFFPASRRSIHGFVKSLGGVQLEHDRPKPTEGLQVGEKAELPALLPLTATEPMPTGRVVAITAFSSACGNMKRGAPYFSRLTRALKRADVPHVMIACGGSQEEVSRVIQTYNLTAPVYFATCDQLEPKLKMLGGIRHYVLDASATVLDAWRGTPIYLHAERNMTAQMLHAATTN